MHKHSHHIIPRHMGGTDDTSNLELLTVEEHAEAHRVLYETYGKHQDYIAWKGLSAQIGKDEIMKELKSLGGKLGSETCRKNKIGSFFDPELRSKVAMKGAIVKGKNKDAKWWSNGTDYKFCTEQPDGYEKSSAPNNAGKKTTGTKWWNNGVSHKRSIECPGEEWVIGRINKGNLGGSREQKEDSNLKRSIALKEYHKRK